MSRVRKNRMHGSKGRGWKRALATARGSEHRRETGGIGATAYGSYRASPLPDRDLFAADLPLMTPLVARSEGPPGGH